MGLMDRDYYREKREDRGNPFRRFRDNPLLILLLLTLLLLLIGYLAG